MDRGVTKFLSVHYRHRLSERPVVNRLVSSQRAFIARTRGKLLCKPLTDLQEFHDFDLVTDMRMPMDNALPLASQRTKINALARRRISHRQCLEIGVVQ